MPPPAVAYTTRPLTLWSGRKSLPRMFSKAWNWFSDIWAASRGRLTIAQVLHERVEGPQRSIVYRPLRRPEAVYGADACSCQGAHAVPQIVTEAVGTKLVRTGVRIAVGPDRVSGGQQGENRGYDFAAESGVKGIVPASDQSGYPSVSFSGAYSTAGDPPNLFTRRNNSFDFLENLSWIRGSHSFKFGSYIFHLQFNPSESPNARGSFAFTPRYTSSAAGFGDGNAFADFLLGIPSTVTRANPTVNTDRLRWGYDFFVTDDYKLSSKLTLNLGLRYELPFPYTEIHNRQTLWIPGRQSVVTPTAPAGRQPGDPI